MVSDTSCSPLVLAEAELLPPLTHLFSSQKEQRAEEHLCLNRAGLLKHAWLHIPKDIFLRKLQTDPTGQAHNSYTTKLGFWHGRYQQNNVHPKKQMPD